MDEVLDNMPREGHDFRHLTRPQLDSLVDDMGEFVPDFVIRYETLEEDFLELSKLLNKPYNLPKLNQTKHSKLAEYKTVEQIERVASLFRKDINFFHYETTRIKIPESSTYAP